MTREAGLRPIAFVAGLAPIGLVLGLLALLLANRHEEPNGFVVLSAVAFLGPMVAASAIALIAIIRRSPPLEVVAGVLLAVCSVFAFSGVTLVLLPPAAFLFYLAATSNEPARLTAPRPEKRSRWVRVVVAAGLTAPLVVLVTARIGILILVAALAIPLATLGVRRTATARRAPPSLRDVALVASIAILVLAGAFVLFTGTQQLCWQRIDTPAGPIESLGPGEPTGMTVITENGESGGCGPIAKPDALIIGLGLLGAGVVLAWKTPLMIRIDGRPPEPPRSQR